jgi:hypothetical protein
MPFMSPSGNHWRCWIGPGTLFYRDHGAYLREADFDEKQSTSSIARYTTGEENHYFGWQDAENQGRRTVHGAEIRKITHRFQFPPQCPNRAIGRSHCMP